MPRHAQPPPTLPFPATPYLAEKLVLYFFIVRRTNGPLPYPAKPRLAMPHLYTPSHARPLQAAPGPKNWSSICIASGGPTDPYRAPPVPTAPCPTWHSRA